MKNFTFFVLASLAAAFASEASASTWRIDPGAIKKLGPEHPAAQTSGVSQPITGTFTLRRDPSGHSSKKGGACLLFQPTRYPRSCASNADCMPRSTSPAGSGSDKVPAGWQGYCVTAIVPNGPSATRQCWYRPGSDGAYCKKSTVDLVENQANSLPVVGALTFHPAFLFGPDRSVRWRVVSCQNLVERKCADPNAREGADKKTRYGPPKAF